MKAESALQQGFRYGEQRAKEIWDNLGKNNLWKRILKNVVATTTLVSICLIPASRNVIGRAAYLGAITTVFGHPGRRFGQMAEALILALLGTVLGVAWSLLGLYLGSLLIRDYPPAAYAIRGIFLAIAMVFHGYLRSRTPRLFIFVLLMTICAVVSLTSTATVVTPVAATQILYPILLAAGVITLVNISMFPEFSSRYIGQMTIETLSDSAKALEQAGNYFVGSAASAKCKSDVQSPIIGTKDKTDSADGECKNNKLLGSHILSKSWWVESHRLLKRLFKNPLSTKNDFKEPHNSQPISLKDLTTSKAQIRKKLSDCKAAQRECNFELAISVLPPREMKTISDRAMKKLVANIIALISACESKFALLGEEGTSESKDQENQPSSIDVSKAESTDNEEAKLPEDGRKNNMPSNLIDQERSELELIKPKREIEYGDVRLLRYLLRRITGPYYELSSTINRTIEVVSACVAHVYDVPGLPSGAKAPSGIYLEELDVHVETMQQALVRFDIDAASALEGVTVIQEMAGREPDIMPREEVFLISSFILNVRQAASHVEDMLRHSRDLVQRRQQRNGQHRVYTPHIKWSNWLYTGGDEVEALPSTGRKANRHGDSDDLVDDEIDTESLDSKRIMLAAQKKQDLENGLTSGAASLRSTAKPAKDTTKSKFRDVDSGQESKSLLLCLRGQAADALEWIPNSEDLLYAMKLSVAVFLVVWPAFVASWNSWYSLNRGLWAALQLVLITEVSIGTSVMTFFLRAVGTTLGCLWGLVALEAGNGNRIVCAVMICIGVFPCAYVQLGTKYPKAGMVCIVSICVVALSTELQTVPGTSTENFLKRYIAFMIGGSVALLVETVLLPVKARTRLVESLAAALQQINEMEKCIASGIEEGVKIDVYAAEAYLRFDNASSKANGALTAAETFLPFCSNEPRIKGSFEGLALIYGEILFVLHQIVDRMDNMVQLRTAYGSGPLEDLNAEIYHYRRNIAGSITLTLFAIHSALTTKLALPQFLPSARLAHLRLINRVREVVLQKAHHSGQDSQELTTKLARQRAVRRKYMSWNAASAAQAEIIEFLEELIDLTKLLVGANEFRSGILMRGVWREYAGQGDAVQEKAKAEEGGDGGDGKEEARDAFKDGPMETAGLTRRRRGTTTSSRSDRDEVPASLRRIQSRKLEAGVRRQRTNESWSREHGK